MSSNPPPVPKDQQSDKIWGEHSPPDTDNEVKDDHMVGDAGVNLKEQDRFGNITQNVDDVQHKVQDR